MTTNHRFKGGYSGMTCVVMVELPDGTGDECGLPAIAHSAASHGADEPCTCDGCWACSGHVIGCTCDIDWDALYEETR